MKIIIQVFLKALIIFPLLLAVNACANSNQDLFQAIEKGNLEEVKFIMTKSVDINKRDTVVGDTPLGRAIRKGYLEIVKYLVEHGANVNEIDPIGRSPLHVAVENQHLDIVKYLVEKGANLNIKEIANGHTPLMTAIFFQNFDIVHYLVTAGAHIDERDDSGRTALDAAKEWGAEAIANYLEGKPNDEKLIATDRLVTAVDKGDLEGVKSALNKGADINKKMFSGWPLFVYAADRKYAEYGKNIEIAKSLIENGADVNQKDEHGRSPLMHMANWGHFDLVKSIMEKGAEIEVKDDKGITALMYGSRNGDFDIFSYLVQKGGNIAERDEAGKTLLMYAVGEYYARDGSPSRLKIIEYLIKEGIDVNGKDNNGWSALMFAAIAIEDPSNITDYLIEYGAKIDDQDNEGWTPLMRAVSQQHFQIIKSLAEKGADVYVKKKDGKNALDIAKEKTKEAKEQAEQAEGASGRKIPEYENEKRKAYEIVDYLESKMKGRQNP